MKIRQTAADDLDDILAVQTNAFGEDEEAQLTADLLADPSAKPSLSLMAFDNGQPVGHVLFTKVTIAGTDKNIKASILAPLAVVPEAQGRGVGDELTREGLRQLAENKTDLVFVLGHPEYYPRFGFRPAGVHDLNAPYPIPSEHAGAWMVLELREGVIEKIEGQVRCADMLDKAEYWRE